MSHDTATNLIVMSGLVLVFIAPPVLVWLCHRFDLYLHARDQLANEGAKASGFAAVRHNSADIA